MLYNLWMTLNSIFRKIFFKICGVAVLAVGIYSRIKAGNWQDLIEDASVKDAANILIASGAFVMIIGFVGCCGAIKQNRPFLIIVCDSKSSIIYLPSFSFVYFSL